MHFPLTCLPGPCAAAPDPCERSSGSRVFQSVPHILPPASRAVLPTFHGHGAAAHMWLLIPLSPSALPHVHSPCCSAGSATGHSGPSELHSGKTKLSSPPKGDERCIRKLRSEVGWQRTEEAGVGIKKMTTNKT